MCVQRARYSRPVYACGPEYDEPACCAPEDDHYTGAYGTPYADRYGSRPSIGTPARPMSSSSRPLLTHNTYHPRP